MKEIISAILLIVTLFGGSVALKNIHDAVRKAALEKASKGLPSLVEMNKALQAPQKRK
jgi:hypothetical protein